MSPVSRVLSVALVLVAAGLGFYVVREHRRQEEQRLALQRKIVASRAAIERSGRERDAAERELAALADAAKEAAVAAAARAAAPPSNPTATAWEQQVATLRSLLARHPQWSIPEIALLTPEEFIFFARDAQLAGDENQRRALRDLRNLAKRKIAPLLQKALHEYAQAHEGRMPSGIGELASFARAAETGPWRPPVPDAVLHRYALAGVDRFPTGLGNEWLLYERLPVDELYDTRQMVGSSTLGQIATDPAIYVLTRAIAAYSEANAGRKPSQPADLTAHLEVALDPVTLGRYFENWQKDPASLGINRFPGGLQLRRMEAKK
jgi:hypothetical protein